MNRKDFKHRRIGQITFQIDYQFNKIINRRKFQHINQMNSNLGKLPIRNRLKFNQMS